MIRLADGLSLPADAVTEVFGILGARGSGKTTTASVFAEELLKAHLPLVILDPTDAWWGLRSSKDGKSDGYPITILGGEHADAPLEETAGNVLADLVAEEAPPLVLSLRLLSESGKRHFVADFCERLYAKNRNALHVVLDEADEFAPQRIQRGGERLFGAVDRIVRRGRSSGLGVTLISQRSAAISKDVLSQCSTLIAHRASHPRDLEPVLEWMKVHATKEQLAEVHGSIAKLKDGEAWVMSPEWLSVFGRFQMRNRTTFNSSATPKAGERRIVPKRLAPVDLAALQKRISATIERAKTEDPRELRRRVAELERELKAKPAAAAPPAPKRVEVPALGKLDRRVIQAATERLERAVAVLQSVVQGHAPGLLKAAADLRAALTPNHAGPVMGPVHANAGAILPKSQPAKDTFPARQRRAGPGAAGGNPASSSENGRLGKAERAILSVLAQRPEGCNVGRLALLAGYTYSGGFRNSLATLRTSGFIHGGNQEQIRITEAGVAALGSFEPLPEGRDLQRYWLEHRAFGKSEREALKVLMEIYPERVPGPDLAKRAGYEWSGGFRNALSVLRTAGVIRGSNTAGVSASEVLFS